MERHNRTTSRSTTWITYSLPSGWLRLLYPLSGYMALVGALSDSGSCHGDRFAIDNRLTMIK
jgi:hypothetical protein